MKAGKRAESQLIKELRRRIAELEALEEERQRIEEALRESQARYQILLEHTGYAVFIFDRDLTLTHINQVVCDLLGYKQEELLGSNVLELGILHPDDYETAIQGIQGLFAGDPVIRNDLRFIKKDGSLLTANSIGVPLKDDRGEIVEFLNIAHDITERKRLEAELEEHREHLEQLVDERTEELNMTNERLMWEIRERERIDKELRESGERYRHLVETMGDGLEVIDEEGRITYANASFCVLLGYKQNEIVGRSIEEFFDQENLVILREQLAQQKKGAREPYEIVWTGKDGSGITTIISPEPLFDDDGDYHGSFGVITDITTRKTIEDELRQSEEMYRVLVRASPDAVTVFDLEGRITYASPQTLELHGYESMDELIGKSAFELIASEDKERAAANLQKVLSEGYMGMSEWLMLHKDGSRFIAEGTAAMIRDAYGEPKSLVAFTWEITERKRVEQALRESEERYRSLIETSPDSIILCDLGGTILMANQSCADLYGYPSAEEVVGTSVFDFIALEDRQRVLDSMRTRPETGIARTEEYILFKKDRSRFYGEVSASLLKSADGKPMGFIGITRDITERKEMEEELRESLERFRGLSEAAFDGIAIHDEGTIISANQAYADMFGYDLDELIGMDGIDFATPEYRDMIRANVASGYEEPYEIVGIRKDGSTFPLELVGKACHYQGKEVRVSAFKDLTEHKKAEEALERSERYYRSLIRNAPDMITIYNPDGTIRWGSRSAGLTTGYLPEDIYDRDSLDFIHPDDRHIVQDALDFANENPGVLKSFEVRYRHKDGSYHLHAATYNNLADDPYVGGIVVNSRDITEQKQAEERLRKLNQCFLSLGANPLDNMRKLALTGKEILEADLVRYGRRDKGQFLVFSSLRETEGFTSPEEAVKYIFHHVISAGEDVVLCTQDLEDGVFENDPGVRALELKSCVACPVRLKGESVGCLCIFSEVMRDFTPGEIDILSMLGKAIGVEEERWANEEELKDFIDIASHELRHPITIMKGYANTLHEIDDRAGVMIRKEVLRAIDKGADRLNKLVLELMEVSRIERERLTLTKKKRRLKPLLEKASKEMQEKGIGNKFNLSVSEKLGRQVVDEDRFIEILVILLDNAVVFSPEGSDVDIIAEPGDEGGARISVMDRGSGIPEEEREKVFERFYQAEEAIHHSTGIGLGLYIARKIVEAHGGRIWCEPREGGGSVFSFTIA